MVKQSLRLPPLWMTGVALPGITAGIWGITQQLGDANHSLRSREAASGRHGTGWHGTLQRKAGRSIWTLVSLNARDLLKHLILVDCGEIDLALIQGGLQIASRQNVRQVGQCLSRSELRILIERKLPSTDLGRTRSSNEGFGRQVCVVQMPLFLASEGTERWLLTRHHGGCPTSN